MRESDEDVVRERRLSADTLRFTVDTRGDYAKPDRPRRQRAKQSNAISSTLASGRMPARRCPEEITISKNGGGRSSGS
jgi:hypothetical protein